MDGRCQAWAVDRLIGDLREVVGERHVLTEPDLRATFETDWTGRYGGRSIAVVRPSTNEEVAGTVLACRAHKASIVTQGGNTGLVGGGVPRTAAPLQVVVSMKRFDEIGDVDAKAMQVTVGAGVTLADWRDAAQRAGLDTAIDFAARGSATVGGAISTNAGGSRVVRFGVMRQQIAGLEAVLADGSIVGSLAGLAKETAGLHWPSVLCGAEGTLGIVTHARLRLVPWYRHTTTAMVTVRSIESACEVLAELRAQVPSLDSVEMIQPGALELVAAHLVRQPPVEVGPTSTTLIVECADHSDPTDELVAVLAGCDGIASTALATDPGPRAAIVAFRDRITEAIASASTELGTPTFKLDVAVPLDRLAELLSTASTAAESDSSRLIAFGHLAEGNVHLNYLGAQDPAGIAEMVLPTVAELGGTISAEHGIGVAKARWLPLIRSAGDLAAQTAITRAIDPNRMFNPGVLGR
jgi:FAD/FMN-containing dehydrogenase